MVVPHDPTKIMHIRSRDRSFSFVFDFWGTGFAPSLGHLDGPRQAEASKGAVEAMAPWQGMARDGNSKLANPREHVGRTSTWKIWRTKRLKFDTCINLYQFVSLISVNGGFSSAARGL